MPPTDKQIRYAWFLHKRLNRELPERWRTDRAVCGWFIMRCTRGEESGRVKYSDEHARRILGGGPLKHDPGPWDEGWTEDSEAQLASQMLADLRARGL